ncbi:hypothetical protein G6L96_014470 [Agrobacterium tumefaciens]|nr:hypothetical protein [Agrobacterium tumefaciens]WCK72406.1 hypothetical protein G6L96_014470 [Agrobacterium tumefaciens]
MTPAEEVVEIASDIFREKWEKQSVGSRERIALLQQEISSTGKSIELLIDRIANSSNRELIEAYEARLVDFQRKKAELSEKIIDTGQKLPDFDATLRTALDFLASPWKLWETGNLEDRRILRKLVFTEHLRYTPESGFRTAETTLPFKVLADIAARNVEMVEETGVEPEAFRLRLD